MSRILVYRAIGLGDFLTGVPALRAVARAFPTAEVCLAAPAPLSPLVPLTGATRAGAYSFSLDARRVHIFAPSGRRNRLCEISRWR